MTSEDYCSKEKNNNICPILKEENQGEGSDSSSCIQRLHSMQQTVGTDEQQQQQQYLSHTHGT